MRIVKRHHTAASRVFFGIGLGSLLLGLASAPWWVMALILGYMALEMAKEFDK